MSDEVMNSLLALLQNTMDGNRMAETQAREIMEGIAGGIREDTRRMQRAVMGMEGLLQELSVILGESIILVPETVIERTVRSAVTEVKEKVEQTQSERKETSYPVAFFYRSKIPGTHGSDGFYLVIDETEDAIVYYLYDQNQKLVSQGETQDKTLPVSAIEEMALNRDVLDYYSCYRMKPELIEVQVSAAPPEENKPKPVEEMNPEQKNLSEKEALLEAEEEKSAEKEQRDKAKTH